MNLKELLEKRNDLVDQIEALTKSVETEQRAFSTEENTKFEELTKAVEDIDKTIEQIERASKFSRVDASIDNAEGMSVEDIEVRAFANYIRRGEDSNITKSDNGAIIPKTIKKDHRQNQGHKPPVQGCREVRYQGHCQHPLR